MKIVLVEDSKFQRNVIKLILQKMDFEVVEFEDGQDVIDSLDTIGDFDIMITDLNMPNLPGDELIQKLKKMNIHRPTFILSAEEDKDLKLRTESLAIKGVLKKPISTDQGLYKILKDALK